MMIGAAQYQLLRKLDDGVLGEVFVARQEGAAEQVVVAFSGALDDEQAEARVLEQAKRWQQLRHPNLARQLDAGRAPDGRLYFVSEYVEGEDLQSRLKSRGPLQPEQLVQLAIPICAGLGYLHQRGLVHGDIRPANILLPGGLEAFHPQLINFGPARSNEARQRNGSASRLAPEYVPPECAEGSQFDARCDVYALGAVMYEALTGSPPFSGANLAEILERHLRSTPPPITGAAAYLNPLIERCLSRSPNGRFSNASELAAALLETQRGRTLSFAPRIRERAAAAPEQPREKEGDVVGSYELVQLIGEGSMGRVFLARHARLGRQVALKVLRPEHLRNRNLIERFFQEARSVNQINHEHIVEVFDFVDEVDAAGSGRVYCVMELLVGSSLTQLQKKEPIGISRAAQIAQQVCAALEAAHQLGVVHRDVKPDNIFVTEKNGESNYIKVLDFGVAKLTSPLGEEKSSGTLEGAIVGTPAYMSPEQAAGLSVDYRADIYGVGVVLYEMLAGRPPFDSPAFGQLVVQIITKAPPALPWNTPAGERIPSELKSLVMSCLEKEPANRPQSMRQLNAALADFAGGARRRRPPLRAYAAIAAGALAAAVLGAAVFWRSPVSARDPNRSPIVAPSAAAGESPSRSTGSALAPAVGGSGSDARDQSLGAMALPDPEVSTGIAPVGMAHATPIDRPEAAAKAPARSAPTTRAPSRRPKRKMERDSIIDPFAN